MGIGGSVIFSAKRGGQGKSNENQYFTAAVVGRVVLAWVGLLLFERPLLTFFGADESLLGIAQTYMRPVKIIFPLFLFNLLMADCCAMTAIPAWPRWACCPAAFSIFSETTFSCFPAAWACMARDWPRPSARPFPFW